MADPIEQPESEEIEASESSEEAQPSDTDKVIEAVLSRLGEAITPILDKRFSGMQSVMDKKVGDLSSQFAQLQKASLSPEELEQQEESDTRAESEKLRQENQLLRLRQDHPDAVDLIIGAMGTATLEEQVAFIESKLGKQVVKKVEAAVEEAAEESSESGESIPNPGRPPKAGAESARFAGEMTDEVADAVLNNQPRGALARLFQSDR